MFCVFHFSNYSISIKNKEKVDSQSKAYKQTENDPFGLREYMQSLRKEY